MKNKIEELLTTLNIDRLIINHSVTAEELIEILNCHIDDDGEIIDNRTGRATGIWYDEIEYCPFPK